MLLTFKKTKNKTIYCLSGEGIKTKLSCVIMFFLSSPLGGWPLGIKEKQRQRGLDPLCINAGLGRQNSNRIPTVPSSGKQTGCIF